MNSSLLAAINLVVFLVLSFFLAGAIARAQWRAGGNAAVILLILLCGQAWLVPQAISFFVFHSTRLLYPLWFGNWIASASGVLLFAFVLRGSSRDLFDAARLDGGGALSRQQNVIWPGVRSAWLAVATILVMATWAEFVQPFLASQTLVALPAAGDGHLPTAAPALALLLALSLAAALPVLAVYFFVGKNFSAQPR